MTFRDAFRAGAIRGVEWGLTLLLILVFTGIIFSDYWTTRIKANKGQAAFDYLNAQIQNTQKQKTQ